MLRKASKTVSFYMPTLDEITQLPAAERLELMALLWDSLQGSDPESPEWHGEVLESRQAKVAAGEAKWLSVDELQERLRR